MCKCVCNIPNISVVNPGGDSVGKVMKYSTDTIY